MDMLQSANSAILSTKTSFGSFSSGLDDLSDSMGVGPFLALVAGAVIVAAGLGSISVSGIARIDEYFGWPLWSSIFPSWYSDQPDEHLKRRRDEVAPEIMRLVETAITKYYEREDQQHIH